MSDEDEDFSDASEAFSASEDDWKPENTKMSESSEDDSDFEQPAAPSNSARGSGGGGRGARKSAGVKGVAKTTITKKKKPSGQSLRAKLFNKYRPPPKTLPTSPKPSTSKTASKNANRPNEDRDTEDENDDDGSSSDSSVDNYLVDPKEIDVNSDFFNINSSKDQSVEKVPEFDCNAGLKNLSDSEDDDESFAEVPSAATQPVATSFDFHTLLENANKMEKAKEEMIKREAEEKLNRSAEAAGSSHQALDTLSLLALGENLNAKKSLDKQPKKTKTTKTKKDTKSSKRNAAAENSDSDEEEFEEVAGYDADVVENAYKSTKDGQINNLEIVVDMPSRQKSKKTKAQEDIENAIKRKLNHEMKKNQLLMHKTSFICLFARSYSYNSILNHPKLMHSALKLLPSANAYPPDKGIEVKYLQSFVTWFKTAVKITNNVQYPLKKVATTKRGLVREYQEQLQKKEARCWQDFVFLFVILGRGMGFHCRLVANLQPLALKPKQTDLLSIKLKKEEKDNGKESNDNKANKSQKGKNSSKSENKASSSKSSGAVKKEVDHSYEKKNQKSKSKKRQNQKSSQATDESDSDGFLEVKGEDESGEQPAVRIERPKRATRNKATSLNLNSIKLEVSENNKSHKEEENEQEEEDTKEPTQRPARATTRGRKANKPAQSQEKNVKSVEAKEFQGVEKEQEEQEEEAASDNPQRARRGRNPVAKPKPDSPEALKANVNKRSTRGRSKAENWKEPEPNKGKPNLSKLKRVHSEYLSDEGDIQLKKKPPSATNTESSKNFSLLDENDFKGFSDNSFLAGEHNSTMITDPQETKDNKASESEREPRSLTKSLLEASIFEGFSDDDDDENSATVEVPPTVNVPKIEIQSEAQPSPDRDAKAVKPAKRETRTRSKSPKFKLDPAFLKAPRSRSVSPNNEVAKAAKPSPLSLRNKRTQNPATLVNDKENPETETKRSTRNRGKKATFTATATTSRSSLKIPQLDGADSFVEEEEMKPKGKASRKPALKKLNKSRSKDTENSEDEFEPSPAKRPKQAPVLPKQVQQMRKDRRVLSTDLDEDNDDSKGKKKDAVDFWVEVWSEVEMQWIPIDLVKGKVNSVETIRKSTSSSLDYVFAYQNDLTVKDVTARYCPHWSITVRKNRMEKDFLNDIVKKYLGKSTERDIREDEELRRIHEEKPLPKSITEFKDHPLYVLERHLLKFQALYPPEIPPVGFIRGEAIYPRDCVHTLHSREIWLKSARVVKLGEQPYKVVKARPKWDRMTQSVIKDQPLEIFGYWQTMEYDPPTAEDGIVPRNAYGNVELFQPSMLPKKTVHLRLPGLARICKKLNIDCANAVIGFDFHQGACHPTYDGFVICEEFEEIVTDAWKQDQLEQERKETEKYEARVYGNWKKLIRGLLIRERLKKKYNF